jgi:nucleotide-binding universal stress UspA family protein
LTYKTILVHIDAGERWHVRLNIAARLAQRFEAHLVGLHALSSARLPGFVLSEAAASPGEAQRTPEAQALRTREEFDRLTGMGGLTSAEWRASLEDAAAVVPLHARYVDLVVIGQPDPDQPAGIEPGFAHRVALAAGRPVLIVPYAGGFDGVGQRVVLAWNASREAARAATDSLPLLRAAQKVSVVCINPKGPLHGEQPGADIALYLARHGVRSEVSNLQGSDIDAGNQLLSYAADLSADLIVMGAYGHSRFSEVVLGGVTRTLMGSMTVPVLMAH